VFKLFLSHYIHTNWYQYQPELPEAIKDFKHTPRMVLPPDERKDLIQLLFDNGNISSKFVLKF